MVGAVDAQLGNGHVGVVEGTAVAAIRQTSTVSHVVQMSLDLGTRLSETRVNASSSSRRSGVLPRR